MSYLGTRFEARNWKPSFMLHTRVPHPVIQYKHEAYQYPQSLEVGLWKFPGTQHYRKQLNKGITMFQPIRRHMVSSNLMYMKQSEQAAQRPVVKVCNHVYLEQTIILRKVEREIYREKAESQVSVLSKFHSTFEGIYLAMTNIIFITLVCKY